MVLRVVYPARARAVPAVSTRPQIGVMAPGGSREHPVICYFRHPYFLQTIRAAEKTVGAERSGAERRIPADDQLGQEGAPGVGGRQTDRVKAICQGQVGNACPAEVTVSG